MGKADAMTDPSRVSISYHAAAIIAGLLPGKQEHLSIEAKQAMIEFLGQVLRARTRQAAEQEQDPDT
jgi:hypothetical protein